MTVGRNKLLALHNEGGGLFFANHASHTHDVTATGSCSAPTFTGSALGTHSHGTGTYATSAHSGTAVADHSAHTHSVTSNVTVNDHASHTHTYTEVPNHVHVENINTATTGGAVGFPALADSSTSGSTATGLSTANPTGGVATGTTAGPSATLTHSVTNNAVTSGNPSATLTHSVTQPSAHTLSGSSEAVGAGTPAGTCSAPTFTGFSCTSTGPSTTLTHSVTQPDNHAAISTIQPSLVVYMWVRES